MALTDCLPYFPPDAPPHGHHTCYGMLSSWFCYIMFPTALVAWWMTSHNVLATAIAFIAIPLFGMVQGAFLILQYRIAFRNAPLPTTPAQGVVIVHPHDAHKRSAATKKTTMLPFYYNRAATIARHNNAFSCSCHRGQRQWQPDFHEYTNSDTTTSMNASSDNMELLQDNQRLQISSPWRDNNTRPPQLQPQPLRLLVFGDSLALGVGTHESCTAILPEVIAKSLSKQLGGRPVSWTSHGNPGASAGWIVRELKKQKDERSSKTQKKTSTLNQYFSKVPQLTPQLSDATSMSSSSSLASTASEETAPFSCCDDSVEDREDEIHESENDLASTVEKANETWQQGLQGADIWNGSDGTFHSAYDSRPYDIVIIMTGANDLKGRLFPMLIGGEEGEFCKQGSSFKDRLQQIVENLEGNPLVVFPGMPTALLPIFRKLPIQWLAIPSMSIFTEAPKAQIAQEFQQRGGADDSGRHPTCSRVLYIPSPTIASAAEFEAQKGDLWNLRVQEDTLLALRTHVTTVDQCRIKFKALQDFCREKISGCRPNSSCASYPGITTSAPSSQRQRQHVTKTNTIPYPPLSERPGLNGSKIVYIDNVHPNDEGYEFWGRHIARSILEQHSF